MKRTLSLVLNDDNTIILNLIKEMDASELDKFILSHFEDSEDIRKYYKKQIDSFLTSHQSYVDKIEKESGKQFRGWIRLLETREIRPGEVSIEQVRILYPKHIAAVPSMIQSQATLKEYQKQYNIRANKYRLKQLTNETSHIVKYFHAKRFYDKNNLKVIKDWMNSKKNTETYFDRIRILVKAYEIVRRRLHLPTIDSLYRYKQLEKQTKKKETHKKDVKESSIYEDDAEMVSINGIKYTLDEIPSLEEEVLQDSLFRPDGMGPRR